jgi:hypothetical protein
MEKSIPERTYTPSADVIETASLARRATAEAAGTALLLAAVVGSGIMGERLAGGNTAIALLANSVATGAALVALILTLVRSQARTSTRPLPWRTRGKAGCAGETCRHISAARSSAPLSV